MASLTLSLIMLVIFLISMVQGRLIRLNTSNPLVSDGLNVEQPSPSLRLDGLSSSSGVCTHDYGFLPCADNVGGYIFQLILYQFLLFVGGHFVTNGSKKLFTMLGTGIFGASVFRVLLGLPRIMFVIISGVSSSKEGAQQQVSLGVAIYAGSTVLSLTLLWGMCVIVGRRDFPGRSRTDSSPSECLLVKEKCSDLTGTGVTTDKETSHTAGIMLLSLIPYAILQLVNIFNTSSSGSRMVMLNALVVSTILLLAYFLYQIFDPWIQKRSLEYSKYEKLVTEFLQYALKHAEGKLVNEKGQPNIPAIEKLFTEADKDDDKSLTIKELENVMHEMESGNVQVDENYALSQMLKTFDLNNDGIISEEEFVEGSKKWIKDAKQIVENGDSTTKKFLSEVVEPFTQRKEDELKDIKKLTAKILKHVQSETLKGLLDDDGSANVERIKTLFKQFDKDENNSISRAELRQLIGSEKFGGVQADDETVDEWMEEIDRDGDNMISEQEFVSAVKNWLKETTKGTFSQETEKKANQSDEKINWEEVDSKLFYKVTHDGSIKQKLLAAWSLSKPLAEIILGVAMLTFLAKPFIESILQLSDAMGLSTFFISFVIVPLITNAKTAISAIFPVSQKSRNTASLTFSEIYGEVIMNNIMGLTTLLAIVYANELTWNYSAEVLIIFLICGVVGLVAFLCTTYPLWTSFLAFFMYLFSLALFYVLQYFWGWD